MDANLIQGNQAGGGHGGGIRLQNVNGADVSRQNRSGMWNVQITNNMIVNNVAGWAGGGLSLSDVSRSSIFNNTIENNDSTATVGAVFTSSPTQSSFQPAGISSELHSPGLAAATNQQFSNPTLANNIIWHNRSFYFQAGATDATGATSTTLIPTLTSQAGYACPAGANYWDLGVLGQPQASPALRLNPVHSIFERHHRLRRVEPQYVRADLSGKGVLQWSARESGGERYHSVCSASAVCDADGG